jgi:FkbM family methyltransferase
MNRAVRALRERLRWLYGLHVRRDPFLREVRRWFRDKGDQTLRLDYPLEPSSTVVDIGGYIGDFAEAIHRRYGCRVLVFEPVPEYFLRCVSRFSGNGNIAIYNYGLGARDAKWPIEIKGDGSSFAQERPGTEVLTVAEVKRVDRALAELGVESVDLMKINIEGGEYDLLELLIATKWIEHVRFLQIQFHHFVPNAMERRRILREKLAATHVEMWNYEFVWESWAARNLIPTRVASE